MSKANYISMKHDILSKIGEILDSARYSKKFEILIDADVGSVPFISYKIYDVQIIPQEGE